MSTEKPKKASKPPAGKTAGKASAKGTSKAAAGKTAAAKPAPKAPAKTTAKAEAAPAKAASRTPKVAPQDWPAFVEKMEKSLLEQKSEIMENLIASNNDFKEIVEGMDPKDLADIASDDIDRRMIEALGSQELKRLKSIDSAITRIKQGKYGHCIKCNKRIPPDRLEAIPYALMCIDCKSDEERRNR